MKNSVIPLLIISILANVIFIISLVHEQKQTKIQERTSTAAQYPYLSKRIFAENQNDILINFIALRAKLRQYVNSAKNPIGLYFEYLPSGVSININEKIETNIASLLKVPLAMSVYKQYELGTLSKNQRLTVGAKHIDKKFGSLWTKGEGTNITVDEAVNLALIESDNTAANILLDTLPKTALDEVADYLDIPKEKQGKFIVISPKNYSSVLRSLYLSAYLQESSSNEIINILTQTSFNDMLAAGIAPDVKVAHKIGVYTLPNAAIPTLSDCGIIYVPQRPYILCVMTNATEAQAKTYISTISGMIYDYVVKASNGMHL